MNSSNTLTDPFVATSSSYLKSQEAAALLGVSVGTVLNMVKRGQLEAWRTEGGHRRISAASVRSYLERRPRSAAPSSPLPALSEETGQKKLEVLVIDDDELLQEIYRIQFSNWKLALNARFASNGVEGLMELGRATPDVLLIDLSMPVMDGFAVIRILRERPDFSTMDVIAITGLDEARIENEGGLPPGIVVWTKPVPFQQLRGFVEARIAAMQRNQQQ